MTHFSTQLSSACQPLRRSSRSAYYYTFAGWLLLSLFVWFTAASPVLPSPLEVLSAFPSLWLEDGLGQRLWVSLQLNLEAIGLMTLLSLSLAYATVLPIMRPVATVISAGRFTGFAALPVILTLWLGEAHSIKLALLVFSMSVFAVPSVVQIIANVPKELLDHARTLRMSEWRVVWEVVILGQFDLVLDVIQSTAAMGWMVLQMVEGLFPGAGGLGALMSTQAKHFSLAGEFAVVFLILGVGLAQDFYIGYLKHLLCPYSELVLEN